MLPAHVNAQNSQWGVARAIKCLVGGAVDLLAPAAGPLGAEALLVHANEIGELSWRSACSCPAASLSWQVVWQATACVMMPSMVRREPQ